MKRIILLLLIALTSYTLVNAQAPAMLNYQGVARNSLGNVLSNKNITLRLSIRDGSANGPQVYSETRSLTTNPFGLFNVQIGSAGANSVIGSIQTVDWPTGRKFIQVEIDPNGGSAFLNVGTTELTSVPFALYSQSGLPIGPASADLTGTYPAPTVAKIRGVNVTTIAPTQHFVLGFDGTNWTPTNLALHPDNYWRLSGNNVFNTNTANIGIGVNNPVYKLDINTSLNDDGLRLRNTSGNIRLRLNSANKEFSVLTAGTGSSFGPGNFVITDVTGNDAARFLINGATGNIAIGGGNTNPVEKLWVNGTSRFTTSSTDFVAIFENTLDGNGDGIQIKLGKTHPAWNGSAFINVPNPVTQGVQTQMNQIRDWIYGNDSFSWGDLINLMPSQYLTGTICNLTNLITSNLNSAMNLPLEIGPWSTPAVTVVPQTTIFGGLDLPSPVPDVPSITIGPWGIPALNIIPRMTLIPQIPQINCSGLPSLSFPVFQFSEVNNSLTKENEFIAFVDKDNRKLGAIRAQSVENFSYDYFDGQKMLDLAAEFIGIDIVDDFMSIIAGISQMVKDYNNIGVEYASGNGDYAEWLEREDPSEMISYGDIVAVKGGKITRKLEGAQQIMAVSKKPIVLGNLPEKGKETLGNNIAFMGQIPVKVMGPIAAGDYIVAKSDVPGYGVAVHPQDMTVLDFKLAVGRSWDTNKKEGPKMVNTVIGVHNHDFLNIISGLQKKADNNEQRLKAIESKLNIVPGNEAAGRSF